MDNNSQDSDIIILAGDFNCNFEKNDDPSVKDFQFKKKLF